jgi:predicted ATPase
MIYLRSFEIPKDCWVDEYFNRSGWDAEDLPDDMPMVSRNTHLNRWYPGNTFYLRGLHNFDFEDITILYGGNGSGKTTRLNVIAQHLRLNRLTRYNRSTCFDDYVSVCRYSAEDLEAMQCIQRGKILVSDDVFDAMLRKREKNEYIDQRREELATEHYQRRNSSYPRHNLTDPHVYEEFKRTIAAKRTSCSGFIKANLQRNIQEQSNGETAFNFFVESIPENALVLLDEPENSLSAKWQLELVKYITGAMRAFHCQFIIATHSPFLLSIPGAKIYDLDSYPIKPERWYNLENVRCYYELFKNNGHLFKEK